MSVNIGAFGDGRGHTLHNAAKHGIGIIIAVDANSGEVKINGKTFMTPAAAGNMSGMQRSYFVAGNLAAIYHAGQNTQNAYAEGGTVKIAGKGIITPVAGDISAGELVTILNNIK